MKKKLILLATWSFLMASLNPIFGQKMSDEVIGKYPPGIVAQVFDLVTKADIDETKQKAIAEILADKELEIFKMLKDGKKYDEIKETNIDFNDQINALLFLEEKYDNYTKTTKEKAKDKYSYTQFAIAIRYRDSLKLSDAQYKAMLNYVDEVKTMKNKYYAANKSSLDTRAFESENIAKSLSNEQYNRLLVFKNTSKATTFAENDWKEVVQRGIDTTFSKQIALLELKRFYLARECTSNKFQHDLVRQKAEIREVYAHKPTILRILEKVRRNPDNDTTTKIYKW